MLIANWRQVLTRAWSARLMYVAAALSALEVALPIVDQVVDIPRGIFAGLSAFTTFAALISRIVAQKGISNAGE